MNTAALMICVAGFLGLPAPEQVPVIHRVDSAPLQTVCRNTGPRTYWGCYVIETETIYLDRDLIHGGTLAHELGHYIAHKGNAMGRVPHSEIEWAARKSETWCRQ